MYFKKYIEADVKNGLHSLNANQAKHCVLKLKMNRD
jgi:hypothetical protein